MPTRLIQAAGIVALALLAIHPAAAQLDRVPPGLTNAQHAQQRSEAQVPPPLQATTPAISVETIRKQARELADRAQVVSRESDQLATGVHPKDLDAELKAIEKLAKKIHDELRQ
jgi:hypothetical protein